MRNYINLLYKKKDYKRKKLVFILFKRITIGIGIITLIIFLIIFFLKTRAQFINDEKLLEKEGYLNQLLARKDSEKKAIYFNDKSSNFLDFLKKDVNFLPYYKRLQEYLPVSSASARIESVSFNNARDVQMIIAFSKYEDFYTFLSGVETDSFLDIFESLTLKSFSINKLETENFKFTLTGRFKDIKTLPI